jgi:hypothetical protein
MVMVTAEGVVRGVGAFAGIVVLDMVGSGGISLGWTGGTLAEVMVWGVKRQVMSAGGVGHGMVLVHVEKMPGGSWWEACMLNPQ